MSDDENKKYGRYITKPNESDMRLLKIDPAVKKSWPEELIDTEHYIVFDKGEIEPNSKTGGYDRQEPSLKPDYILLLDKNDPSQPTIAAFVEAKKPELPYDHGIAQAKIYADSIKKVKFAYATNGREINPKTNWGIREFDFIKLDYATRGTFPTPDELKQRLRAGGFGDELPFFLEPHKMVGQDPLRYYQEGAVNGAIEAIIKGKKRILLNLATGTGKTKIAYQITRKLWEHYLEPNGNHPKFLFLTDRNQLVDQAMEGAFSPFDERCNEKVKG